MSLLSKFLGRGSNEYVYLREAFASHHHKVEEDLHANHPHAVPTLEQHGVDLKTVRRRAASVVAAAAIAGLLLARPHHVGAPQLDRQQAQEHTQLAANSSEKGSAANKLSHSKAVSLKKPASSGSSSTTSETNEKPSKKNVGKGHKGHIRGRSYLAPPKEHGLHDLGLHKGDKNAPHPIKEKGKKA